MNAPKVTEFDVSPGVNYTDRSRQAELDRILSEARYQLNHNYGVSGGTAYPDGLLYDCVILSDGTCVRTRARPQQLWHCGNALGNEESFALHLMLGPAQDATPIQWQRVLRVMDEVRSAHTFPVAHIVGHNEWPRHNGEPRPSLGYTVLPEQSVCPGQILHARLAAARAAASIPDSPYTADSLLIGWSHATPEQCAAYILVRPHTNYSDADIRDVIIPAYFDVCRAVGIDATLAVAQMIHETGNLTSFWSARGPQNQNPRRNPAGIGVTGDHQRFKPDDATYWAYNPSKRWWEAGNGFPSWKDHSVPAHVGRLLAYTVAPDSGTPAQRALIATALAYRPLPLICQGSAQTIRQLGKAENPHGDHGCGWAGKDTTEGATYGERIAAIANAIVRTP